MIDKSSDYNIIVAKSCKTVETLCKAIMTKALVQSFDSVIWMESLAFLFDFKRKL